MLTPGHPEPENLDLIKTVQSRLGHATAAETLDTYSHLWPDADDTTRTAVDSVLKIDSAADTVQTKFGN